jgi:hypothetical protein
MKWVLIMGMLVFVISCRNKMEGPVEVIRIDPSFIDSIRKESDTSYTRSIGAGEFYTAEQLLDREDSTITKILRDTAGRVTGMVQYRKGIRTFIGEYYINGQLKGKIPLDDKGQVHGEARYYYEDGRVRSEGAFQHGLYAGTWKLYDARGKLGSTEWYDSNGQLVTSH